MKILILALVSCTVAFNRDAFLKQKELNKAPHLNTRGILGPTVVLSSAGRAAEHYGGWLGEYVLVEGAFSDGRPMYRQRDDVANPLNLPTQAKNSKTFLYYKADCSETAERGNDPTPGWMVGNGDCVFGLKSLMDTANPPVTGWQFWTDSFGGRKRDDTSLKLEFGSLAPCRKVEVAAQGEAAEVLQEQLGSYFPDGHWSQGRPVYRKTSARGDNYLRVAPGRVHWSVGDSAKSKGAWIEGGKGTLSPGDPAAGPNLKNGLKGWAYWHGGEWEDSGSRITVTCPTVSDHDTTRLHDHTTAGTEGQVSPPSHLSDLKECNTGSCATVVLSSTEGAAEWQGNLLGEYLLVEGASSDGRPVYSHREDVAEGGGGRHLYYKENCSDQKGTLQNDTTPGWIVGRGGCGYNLKNSANTASPPMSGWRFWSGGRMIYDQSLRLEFGSLEPCTRVEVAAQGGRGAALIRQAELGSYFPTDRWLQGRPVYSKTEGGIRYLKIPKGYNTWSVDNTLNGTEFFLYSGRGTLSPGDSAAGPSLKEGTEGWSYWADGVDWEDSGSRITVTCHTVSNVDCVVSSWRVASECNVTCGGGSKSRVRQITTQPQGEGAECPHLRETSKCNTECCPVGCEVSSWSPWGSCLARCGGGTKSRIRSVTTQASCGGAGCPHLRDSVPCNTESCASSMVLSSKGQTAERYGILLGEYMEEGTSGGRPYYKQRDDVGKTDWFLFYNGSCLHHGWVVGQKVGDCFSIALRNPADTASPPGELEWQLRTSSGNWVEDSSLGLELGSLAPCRRVEVAAQGEAAVVREAELGSYFPTGDWLQGRPVYSKTEGGTRFLRMAEQSNGWRVADTQVGKGGFLNNIRGTLSPGDSAAEPNVWYGLKKEGWRYWHSDKWHNPRGQVTVTCSPDSDGPAGLP